MTLTEEQIREKVDQEISTIPVMGRKRHIGLYLEEDLLRQILSQGAITGHNRQVVITDLLRVGLSVVEGSRENV